MEMPSHANSTVKGVRIENDVLAEFEKKLAGQSINSWFNEKILEFIGGKPCDSPAAPFSSSASDVSSNSSTSSKKESFMSIDLDNEVGKDLIQMLSLSKKSPSEFVKDVHGLLESGSLIYENGKLRVEVGFDYDPFLEFCRKHNARPKKVFENIMEEIYKEFGRN